MKTIPAAKFKAQCLALMDEVEAKRQPLLITKRGKPVAKLVPAEVKHDDFFDRLKGKVRIVGDIESPLDPPEAWEVMR
jgi:prevent-host-death family protein